MNHQPMDNIFGQNTVNNNTGENAQAVYMESLETASTFSQVKDNVKLDADEIVLTSIVIDELLQVKEENLIVTKKEEVQRQVEVTEAQLQVDNASWDVFLELLETKSTFPQIRDKFKVEQDESLYSSYTTEELGQELGQEKNENLIVKDEGPALNNAELSEALERSNDDREPLELNNEDREPLELNNEDREPLELNSAEIKKMILGPRVTLIDLQLPKQATVNSSSGQIDEQTFVCFTSGAKITAIHELNEHQEIHNRPSAQFPEEADEHSDTTSAQHWQEKCDRVCLERAETDKPFKCQFCKKAFSLKRSLHRHEFTHTGQKLTCQFCTKVFKSKSAVRKHERSHTQEKPVIGRNCIDSTTIDCNLSLVKQEQSHCDEEPLKCNSCNQIGQLHAHECPQKHEKPFACKLGGKEFVSKFKALVHEQTHPPFKCPYCVKTFLSKTYFLKHEYSHSFHSGEKPLKCIYCSKVYHSNVTLRRHERRHERTHLKPFVCQFCAKAFSEKGDLNKHERRIHIKEKGFKCHICNKMFFVRYDLTHHERTHRNESAIVRLKINKCQFCDYETVHSLLRHERRHTDHKPFKCNFCNHRFRLKQHLFNHERIHTGDKPFKCKFCNQQFNVKSNLAQHEHTHKECKPFVCEVCGKGFAQSTQFKQHRYIHTGEKPHHCRFCCRSFRSGQQLKVHTRIHTGEKPLSTL